MTAIATRRSMRWLLAGLTCLTGCLLTSPDGWTPLSIWPKTETVLIWDGNKCFESRRTLEQLVRMHQFRRGIYRENGLDMVSVYADDVEPARIQEFIQRGGTIVVPSGESMTFPPLNTVGVAGVVKNGRLELDGGVSLPVEASDAEGLVIKYRHDPPDPIPRGGHFEIDELVVVDGHLAVPYDRASQP